MDVISRLYVSLCRDKRKERFETILEPLNLTDQQTIDLIAFLESLTSPLPDETLLKAPE